jgi:hypothetical protein
MLKYPWSSSIHVQDTGNTSLLLAAALAMLFFVLEYCGNELMGAANMLAKVTGFLVAYPLAVLIPIAVGWWLIRHDSSRKRHW